MKPQMCNFGIFEDLANNIQYPRTVYKWVFGLIPDVGTAENTGELIKIINRDNSFNFVDFYYWLDLEKRILDMHSVSDYVNDRTDSNLQVLTTGCEIYVVYFKVVED